MQQNTIATNQPEMDEIDLTELVAKLRKRKKLIGGVAAAFLALAVLATFVRPQNYTVVANINIGFAHGFNYTPAQLVNNIASMSFEGAEIFAEVPPRAKGTVKLTVTAQDRGIATATAKEILNRVITEHKIMIDSNLAASRAILSQTQDEIDRFNAKENKKIDIADALSRQDALARNLSSYNYKYIALDSKSFDGDVNNVKAGSKKMVTIVIGAVAGFVVGIFLALALDWWEDFRARRAESESKPLAA